MSRSDQRGFSLLEAIVAFAITGLALTALLQLYATSATASRRSVETLGALNIAENLLAELADVSRLVEGATSGVTPEGYAWRVEIAQSDDPASGGPLALFDVAVEVTPPARDRAVVHLQTARHAPRVGAPDGGDR